MIATLPAPLLRRLERVEARRTVTTPITLDAVALSLRGGIEPDPWQTAVLRGTATQIALLCCRQSGKSTTAATLGLSVALTKPGVVVLVLSPGERQSRLLFKTMLRTYGAAGRPVPAEAENKLSLELANGSEIHALPGNEATVRGFSDVALILVDEAARVPDDLYMAVRPMLAVSGGRIVLMSTPFGKRGFFWQEWTEGGPDWHRTKITVYGVPRIPPAWIAKERARIPDWWFRQEYLCEFVETEDTAFAFADVEASLTADVVPLGAGRVFA